MTISIDSSNFQISSFFEIPEFLRQLLYKAWQNRYEEFYEELEDDNLDLEETLFGIIEAFQDQDNSLCHARYVCMALILALAVQYTVKTYFPDEQKTGEVFQLVISWSNNVEISKKEIIDQLFPQISVGCQATDEALSVFKSLLEVLDFDKAQDAVLEILDCCLEGYAIFPGSQGRRDLFKWWLLEVVPAAWCLKFPESLYTIKDIITFDSTALPNKLIKIFDSYNNQGMKNLPVIAYIDNSSMFQSKVKSILQSSGYQVISIFNPNNVLQELSCNMPDLILMDTKMPNMDGFELCKTLRGYQKFKNIPIIILTDGNIKIDPMKAKSVGGDQYLRKSMEPQELIDIVKKHLVLN